jgi:hypothetical protein
LSAADLVSVRAGFSDVAPFASIADMLLPPQPK